ncbi:hypothetical protein FHG87_011297 [Trinorchestia longiramus]|nr:hypothetical protein FHG87_011297 [Trinorchestia longiramus]
MKVRLTQTTIVISIFPASPCMRSSTIEEEKRSRSLTPNTASAGQGHSSVDAEVRRRIPHYLLVSSVVQNIICSPDTDAQKDLVLYIYRYTVQLVLYIYRYTVQLVLYMYCYTVQLVFYIYRYTMQLVPYIYCYTVELVLYIYRYTVQLVLYIYLYTVYLVLYIYLYTVELVLYIYRYTVQIVLYINCYTVQLILYIYLYTVQLILYIYLYTVELVLYIYRYTVQIVLYIYHYIPLKAVQINPLFTSSLMLFLYQSSSHCPRRQPRQHYPASVSRTANHHNASEMTTSALKFLIVLTFVAHVLAAPTPQSGVRDQTEGQDQHEVQLIRGVNAALESEFEAVEKTEPEVFESVPGVEDSETNKELELGSESELESESESELESESESELKSGGRVKRNSRRRGSGRFGSFQRRKFKLGGFRKPSRKQQG